jgi:hypothetical protein
VELERLTKNRMATLSGPAPTSDLVGRLLAMGGPAGPLRPRPSHVPGMPRPQTVPLSAAAPTAVVLAPRRTVRPARPAGTTRPAGRPVVFSPRRTRLAAAVLGALSVVGVGVAGITVGAASTGAVSRPVAPQLGRSSTIGATLLTTTVSGRSSFDWLEGPSVGDAGRGQRLLVRR